MKGIFIGQAGGSVAGAETKMQRVTANKGTRARERRAADIRAAPHKYLHANRGATTSKSAGRRNGSRADGALVTQHIKITL
jgi:hypothetical protein